MCRVEFFKIGKRDATFIREMRVAAIRQGQCLEYLGYITLPSSLKVELAIKLQTAIMLVCLAGLP